MPISAGSLTCPPYIADQEQHRKAITQWMMRVSPIIAGGSFGAGLATSIFNLQNSLSAVVVNYAPHFIIATRAPYNVPNDGVTNIQPALSAACATLNPDAGGVVVLPPTGTYLLATSFIVPRGVTLTSGRERMGTAWSSSPSKFQSVGGRVNVNSGATFVLQDNSGLDGLCILQPAVALPILSSGSFTGVAVTIAGDDTFIQNCFIGGFNHAIYSQNCQRVNVHYNCMDNQNNVYLSSAYDVPRITNNHCWPFFSVGGAGGASANHRTGTSFNIRYINDWTKLTDNFCYGYQRGYQLIDVNNVTLMGCGADNTTINTGSIGFEILGTCRGTQLIGCQAAANSHGVHIATSADAPTNITNISLWGNVDTCMLVDSGMVHVTNSYLNGAANSIVTNFSANGAFHIADTLIQTPGTAPFLTNITNSTTTITRCRFDPPFPTLLSGVTAQLPGLSVSATLSPSTMHNTFNLIGSGTVTTVLSTFPGREITFLVNTDVVTFKQGAFAANSFNLNGSLNFSATAGSTLTIVHNGQQWLEKSRSKP